METLVRECFIQVHVFDENAVAETTAFPSIESRANQARTKPIEATTRRIRFNAIAKLHGVYGRNHFYLTMLCSFYVKGFFVLEMTYRHEFKKSPFRKKY